MNKEVLETIFGTKIIDIGLLKKELKFDSVKFLSELEEYRIFSEEQTEIIDAIENIYKKLSKEIINSLSEKYLKMPIEMAIATKNQSLIKTIYAEAAERFGFDEGLQQQINADLNEIANRLNKRFTFDEADLIHLIEASKNSNIQLEEDFIRLSQRNRYQVLKQRADGTYYLADTTPESLTKVYTTGRSMPTVLIGTSSQTPADNSEHIELTAYPGGKDIVEATPGKTNEEIMRDIMKNLFANLELCEETYKFFYTKDHTVPLEDSVAIKNTAILDDDSKFDFYFRINKENLPHLLGIQTGGILSPEAIRYFAGTTEGFTLNSSSSAFKILKALLQNKERIINDGGLVQGDDGKIYQLLPWEKIVLKTSSFMRGDFFKTCFCLAHLPNGINSPKEKYTSISTTNYSGNMVTEGIDVKKILRDLINAKRHGNDFVFRVFVGEKEYIPDSIMTGKAETITVQSPGRSDFRLETLNRYRNALSGSDGGSVVKSIENEIMGKRIFTPAEQALTHINVTSGLGLGLGISPEAQAFEMLLLDKLDNYLDDELRRILSDERKIK